MENMYEYKLQCRENVCVKVSVCVKRVLVSRDTIKSRL